MRVLYINAFSLLYSQRYINSTESVRIKYLSEQYRSPLDVMNVYSSRSPSRKTVGASGFICGHVDLSSRT